MRKIVALLVALSLLAVAVPTLADGEVSADDREDRKERVDTSEPGMKALEPASPDEMAEMASSVHERLLAPQPLDSQFGNDAGCNANGQEDDQWAQSGTPDGPCEDVEYHNFGIRYTSMFCEQACVIDAADWSTYGFLVLQCYEASVALADWTELTLYTFVGSCDGGFFGSPTSFSDWDSAGDGDWSHTDNQEDALHHLFL